MLRKLLVDERRRGVAGSGIGVNPAYRNVSPHLAPQRPQLGFQRIRFSTGMVIMSELRRSPGAPSARGGTDLADSRMHGGTPW